ncbi:MAG: hypothetical protein ACRCX2_12815 [Paraclostridium sp.]
MMNIENQLFRTILSLDCETNGLWGGFLSISYQIDGGMGVTFALSPEALSKVDVNKWVREHVLPHIPNKSIRTRNEHINLYDNELDMLKDFAEWYKTNIDQYELLWHMGHCIESRLFGKLIKLGYIGEWDAPYTPIELSSIMRVNGLEPDSTSDAYKKLFNQSSPYKSHSSLDDCREALAVYNCLVKPSGRIDRQS